MKDEKNILPISRLSTAKEKNGRRFKKTRWQTNERKENKRSERGCRTFLVYYLGTCGTWKKKIVILFELLSPKTPGYFNQRGLVEKGQGAYHNHGDDRIGITVPGGGQPTVPFPRPLKAFCKSQRPRGPFPPSLPSGPTSRFVR